MNSKTIFWLVAAVIGVNLFISLLGVLACTYAGFQYRKPNVCPDLEARLDREASRYLELFLAFGAGKSARP